MTAPADIFRDGVYAILNSVHTCLPGIVKSYNFSTNKAVIQPALNKAYFSGEMPMPVLESVPIMFPKNIVFPIETGDYVLLLFAERSIDLWLNEGGIVTPDDPRKFNLSDAIAIPGLQTFADDYSENNGNEFKISYAGSEIKILANGDIQIKTSNKVAIGTSANELLKIVSDLLQFLSTSVTTAVGQPIQGALPALIYSNLKAQVEAIRGTIT